MIYSKIGQISAILFIRKVEIFHLLRRGFGCHERANNDPHLNDGLKHNILKLGSDSLYSCVENKLGDLNIEKTKLYKNNIVHYAE